MTKQRHNAVKKTERLLKDHKGDIIEGLGVSAFDLLTPRQVADALGVEPNRLPDLLREQWLEPAPGKDIGRAHLYYRWRVEFIKQFRKTRHKPEEKQPTMP